MYFGNYSPVYLKTFEKNQTQTKNLVLIKILHVKWQTSYLETSDIKQN